MFYVVKANRSTHLCSTCFCTCSACMSYPETHGMNNRIIRFEKQKQIRIIFWYNITLNTTTWLSQRFEFGVLPNT